MLFGIAALTVQEDSIAVSDSTQLHVTLPPVSPCQNHNQSGETNGDRSNNRNKDKTRDSNKGGNS